MKTRTKVATTNYPVGDFLIKVKNTSMAKNKSLEVISSKQIVALAESLKKLGYLNDIKKEKTMLNLSLAFKNKKPVLIDLKLVSKPGLRVYWGADEIASKKGPSTFLISTPKGILSAKEATKQRMGGEVIAEIW